MPDQWEGTPRWGKRGGWIQVSYRFGAGFVLKGRPKPPQDHSGANPEGRRPNAKRPPTEPQAPSSRHYLPRSQDIRLLWAAFSCLQWKPVRLVARILLPWPRTKLRGWWRTGDLLVPVRDDCLAMSADEGLKGRRRNRRTPWVHFGALNLIEQAVKIRFGFSRLPGVRIVRVLRPLE